MRPGAVRGDGQLLEWKNGMQVGDQAGEVGCVHRGCRLKMLLHGARDLCSCRIAEHTQ